MLTLSAAFHATVSGRDGDGVAQSPPAGEAGGMKAEWVENRAAPEAPSHVPAERLLDCDICVLGDDLAGLLIACELAARSYDVALVELGEQPSFGFDASLAPGFALPTTELIARAGLEDAREILNLSVKAAERGMRYATEAGLELGPRGRLAAARPHAEALLRAEHEARDALAPRSSLLLGADETRALLGTRSFSAALGLAPARRLNVASLRAILKEAARQSDVRVVTPSGGISADLNGVRKYVVTAGLRLRAFHVVLSGGAALKGEGISGLSTALSGGLVSRPWVSGSFDVSSIENGYHGLVDEFGSTGLRFLRDDAVLNVASETAFLASGEAGAARVLRRHVSVLGAQISALQPRAVRSFMRTHSGERMPLIFESEKAVWCCLTLGDDEPAHGMLAAELIVGAIADKDDRIRLLQPFGIAASTQRPLGRLETIVSYGYARVSRILPLGRPVPAGGKPALLPPAQSSASARNGVDQAAQIPPVRKPCPPDA